MTHVHDVRDPDLAVVGLPVALLGNPLLLATAVGRRVSAAGTLRIAGILLGVGGVSLAIRLRRVGGLVVLLLGVIGLLVLAVGFFLLLGLGSRGLRRLFFAWLLLSLFFTAVAALSVEPLPCFATLAHQVEVPKGTPEAQR